MTAHLQEGTWGIDTEIFGRHQVPGEGSERVVDVS
jgi:hypothetical protein